MVAAAPGSTRQLAAGRTRRPRHAPASPRSYGTTSSGSWRARRTPAGGTGLHYRRPGVRAWTRCSRRDRSRPRDLVVETDAVGDVELAGEQGDAAVAQQAEDDAARISAAPVAAGSALRVLMSTQITVRAAIAGGCIRTGGPRCRRRRRGDAVVVLCSPVDRQGRSGRPTAARPPPSRCLVRPGGREQPEHALVRPRSGRRRAIAGEGVAVESEA